MNNNFKSFKDFRREWILNPSKEMIVEKEIVIAYDKYKHEKEINRRKKTI